jgi:hypothetical protein
MHQFLIEVVHRCAALPRISGSCGDEPVTKFKDPWTVERERGGVEGDVLERGRAKRILDIGQGAVNRQASLTAAEEDRDLAVCASDRATAGGWDDEFAAEGDARELV